MQANENSAGKDAQLAAFRDRSVLLVKRLEDLQLAWAEDYAKLLQRRSEIAALKVQLMQLEDIIFELHQEALPF